MSIVQTMRAVGAAVGLAAVSAMGMLPPEGTSFETKLCRASHVFLGTGHKFRVVRLGPADCLSMGRPETLAACEVVEVEVAVDAVLKPEGWSPKTPVTFQFGGGHFNVVDLRKDLEGTRRLFHTVREVRGGRDVFVTSYPWALGASEDQLETAKGILKACVK